MLGCCKAAGGYAVALALRVLIRMESWIRVGRSNEMRAVCNFRVPLDRRCLYAVRRRLVASPTRHTSDVPRPFPRIMLFQWSLPVCGSDQLSHSATMGEAVNAKTCLDISGYGDHSRSRGAELRVLRSIGCEQWRWSDAIRGDSR